MVYAPNKKFCSKTCKEKKYIKTYICEYCKKTFTKYGKTRFCNRSCSNAWQHANGIRRDYLNDKSMKEWVLERQGQERFNEILKNQSKAKLGKKNHRFGKTDHTHGISAYRRSTKDKTLEEIHGEEKATQIRKKMSKSMIGEKNPMFGKPQRRGGNSIKGWYKGRFFRSLLEYSFMKHLETTGVSLKDIRYECYNIPYTFRGTARSYRPDFEVGTTVYEVKQSFAVRLPINIAKKEAAISFLNERNRTYVIITEKEFVVISKEDTLEDSAVKLLK